MIEVRIESVFHLRRRPCLFCGGWSNKDEVAAMVFDDGERTGHVACDACLARSTKELAAVLRQQAADLRANAQTLERLASNLPKLPSPAALAHRRVVVPVP